MRMIPSALLVLLAGCAPKVEPPPATTAPAPAPELPAYAKDLVASIDTTTPACEDFYQFACGSWLKSTTLPADKASWTRSFSVIREQNLAEMKTILEETAANPGTDPDRQKLGTYFGACMSEDAANTAGLTPLQPIVKEIDTIKDAAGFMEQVGKLQALGAQPFMQAYTDGDYKNPGTTILYLTQGGLSFPDKKYYDSTDTNNAALLTELEALIAKDLERLGTKDAAALAKKVVAFESGIAAAWIPREDVRDPTKTYHKIDRAGLLKLTPGLKWDKYLSGLGAGTAEQINVETPDTFQKMEALVKKTDVATLKAYLKWQLIHGLAGSLDNETFNADFALFRGKVAGQKEPEARWKRCVTATDNAMGELLAKAYIERRFPGDSKTIAVTMIQNVENAFANGLPGLAWMDETTRGRAVEKMKMIVNKIGYPDKWRDYSALVVTPNQHAANQIAANRFETARQVAKVGQPADRNEWLMTPPTVNAYYNPTQNEMAFPAGILQPPFFSKDYPAAMNYGAIGMVMGHELTHGFDDQGAKFNGKGEMVDWWTPEAVTKFGERTGCVVDQYDKYEPQPGLKVNGKLTTGENIADIGGIRSAYRAYKALGAPSAAIPGYTDDQVFFIAFAQGWCTVQTPELEKMRILSDTHSPPKYRVNGPLADLPEFAAAFGCAPESKMAPKDRCEVW